MSNNMIEEHESQDTLYLKCKICQKEFPRFDQRGFRNAGFTAHQNRCIEREYLLNNPVVERQSSPRQRLILPAPPTSNSSSPSSIVIAGRSNSTSPIIQQPQQTHHQLTFLQQQQQTVDPYGAVFQTTSTFVPEDDLFYNMHQNYTHEQQQQHHQHGTEFEMSFFPRLVYQPTITTAIPTPIPKMVFPITHCDYCVPEYDLHQPTCLYLAEYLRQSGSI